MVYCILRCMNIHPIRLKGSQILILVILLQAALFGFIYIQKSRISNLELISTPEDEEEISRKDITTNLTLNFFTKQLSSDDEKRLLNLTNFDYKIKKECGNESVLLLVAVSSAPGNQLKRNAIRETWGQPDSEVKIVFMLGDSSNPNVTRTLQIEDMTFNDIVQGNFLASYKNLTYKSTMALKHAVYNCHSAKFLLKCDDDVLINTPLLKNFLKRDLSVLNTKNSIFCTVNNARFPIRNPTGRWSKWYVSYQEWPEENFPKYCAGFYVLMTLDVAFDIYRNAQNSTYFWIDDVFLTGIAARNIHELRYVDVTKFTLVHTAKNNILSGNLSDVPFLVGPYNMPPNYIRILWQYILSKPVEESIFKDLIKISYQDTIKPHHLVATLNTSTIEQ